MEKTYAEDKLYEPYKGKMQDTAKQLFTLEKNVPQELQQGQSFPLHKDPRNTYERY